MKKIWVVTKMDREYNDEETGATAWGVYPTEGYEGYGVDTFSTRREAQEWASEQNDYEEVRKMRRVWA